MDINPNTIAEVESTPPDLSDLSDVFSPATLLLFNEDTTTKLVETRLEVAKNYGETRYFMEDPKWLNGEDLELGKARAAHPEVFQSLERLNALADQKAKLDKGTGKRRNARLVAVTRSIFSIYQEIGDSFPLLSGEAIRQDIDTIVSTLNILGDKVAEINQDLDEYAAVPIGTEARDNQSESIYRKMTEATMVDPETISLLASYVGGETALATVEEALLQEDDLEKAITRLALFGPKSQPVDRIVVPSGRFRSKQAIDEDVERTEGVSSAAAAMHAVAEAMKRFSTLLKKDQEHDVSKIVETLTAAWQQAEGAVIDLIDGQLAARSENEFPFTLACDPAKPDQSFDLEEARHLMLMSSGLGQLLAQVRLELTDYAESLTPRLMNGDIHDVIVSRWEKAKQRLPVELANPMSTKPATRALERHLQYLFNQGNPVRDVINGRKPRDKVSPETQQVTQTQDRLHQAGFTRTEIGVITAILTGQWETLKTIHAQLREGYTILEGYTKELGVGHSLLQRHSLYGLVRFDPESTLRDVENRIAKIGKPNFRALTGSQLAQIEAVINSATPAVDKAKSQDTTTPINDRPRQPEVEPITAEVREIASKAIDMSERFKQLDIRAFPPERTSIEEVDKDVEKLTKEYGREIRIERERVEALLALAESLRDQDIAVETYRLLPGSLGETFPYYVVVIRKDGRTIVVAENPKHGNATYVFEELDPDHMPWQDVVQFDKKAVRQIGGKDLRHSKGKAIAYHYNRVIEELGRRLTK